MSLFYEPSDFEFENFVVISPSRFSRFDSEIMDSDRDKKIDEFVAITGVSRGIADSLLKVCNDNLEMAINMQMEGVQTEQTASTSNSNASNFDQPGTSSASQTAEDEGKILIKYLKM